MLENTAAVFLVLGLLIATLVILRRKGLASLNLTFPKRSESSRRLRIVERIPLTAHHSLHLVQIENRMILIAVSPSGCNRIHSFTAALDEIAAIQESP
jgi:flagellar biosynthetic protein FliO